MGHGNYSTVERFLAVWTGSVEIIMLIATYAYICMVNSRLVGYVSSTWTQHTDIFLKMHNISDTHIQNKVVSQMRYQCYSVYKSFDLSSLSATRRAPYFLCWFFSSSLYILHSRFLVYLFSCYVVNLWWMLTMWTKKKPCHFVPKTC